MRRLDYLADQPVGAIGAVDKPASSNCAVEQFLIVSAYYLGVSPERLLEFIQPTT